MLRRLEGTAKWRVVLRHTLAKAVDLKLCAAELRGSADGFQGFRKHIYLIMKLVNEILVILIAFCFSYPSLCVDGAAFIFGVNSQVAFRKFGKIFYFFEISVFHRNFYLIFAPIKYTFTPEGFCG